MRKGGTDTRTAILDAAERLVLRHGYAATSLDLILGEVELTKGAFFHHFESKGALAHALLVRFAERDRALLERVIAQAERLSRDPVQRLILAVGLLEEEALGLTEPHPGCLMASYCYERQLFGDEIHAIIADAFVHWREGLGRLIREAMAVRAPLCEVSASELADMLTALSEGSFIMSRAMNDPALLARQLHLYRNYLELLFGEAPPQ
jgi:TetR/AcrR family transcriptional regulator, transcriptional repressor for nem operon